jgi:hypothetical protein
MVVDALAHGKKGRAEEVLTEYKSKIPGRSEDAEKAKEWIGNMDKRIHASVPPNRPGCLFHGTTLLLAVLSLATIGVVTYAALLVIQGEKPSSARAE